MLDNPRFSSADLDRLNEVVEAVISPADVPVWRELIALGRNRARAREAAENAGLVAGSPPLAERIGNIADAFRRSYGDGTRATVGNLPPRR